MKKLLFLTVLSMLFAVNAAADTKSGIITGTSINWTYDTESYTLTLSGSGALPDYNSRTLKNHYFRTDEKALIVTSIHPVFGYEEKYYIIDVVKHINIGSGINTIGKMYFSGAEYLEKLTLSESVTVIKDEAFEGCTSLYEIDGIINNDIEVARSAFEDCQFIENNNGILVMGNTLVVADPTYYVENITIPSNVTKIKSEAFIDYESLQTITFEGNLTSIGDRAFSGCSNLTTITFADNTSLTTIGNSAFSGCSNLNSINVPHTVTSWGTNIFNGCISLPVVGDYIMPCKHVIVGVKNTGKSEYTIGEDVTYIADNAFIDCDNVQKIYCYAEKAPTSATPLLGNYNSYILYVNDGCENDFITKWKVKLDRINTTKVAIGSSGYTTLTLIHSAKVPKGTKAYTATINNGSIELTEVRKLAKGVGYIIWSTNGTSGTYDFNAAEEAVVEPSENMMKGVLENTTLVGDGSIYLLSLYKGVVGFRCLGDNTYNLPAGKAYLQSDDSSGSVERDFLNFGGDETDIEDTKEDEIINSRNNTTYNLAGQKLNAPQKGLNIVDGKLVLL